MVQRLDVSSEYLSDHISNYVPVYGRLPQEKASMLETIEQALKAVQRDENYRRSLEKRRYLTHL